MNDNHDGAGQKAASGWSVLKQSTRCVILDEERMQVAECWSYDVANKLAAAPDLFAALEALEKAASAFAYKADRDDDGPVRDACDAARAALRKARGEVQP